VRRCQQQQQYLVAGLVLVLQQQLLMVRVQLQQQLLLMVRALQGHLAMVHGGELVTQPRHRVETAQCDLLCGLQSVL
jgi:RNase P/RNase MRP subunit p29